MRVLARWEKSAAFVEDILEDELDQLPLPPVDRRLVQELCYGVVRWRAALDWLIAQRTSNRTQNPALQILLRLGFYQAFWLDRIPDHAIVHESVEMAKRLGFQGRAGFINATLRGCLRERDAIEQSLENLKTLQPPIGHSHPAWLVDRWIARWGKEKTGQLLNWNNTPSPIYARVNTLRADAARLTAQWREEGVVFEAIERDWIDRELVFEVRFNSPIARCPSFQQGWFYIQDPSTLLAVEMLNPKPGENILDYCAAPGGKTAFIAQKMKNEGRVFACDVHDERLALLRENCERLGVTCVEPALAIPAEADATSFDRILVDVPCSNTGVMRRRVDLRWRIRPEEIALLRSTQLELLKGAATLLKPGGVLIYSTCSIEPEENQDVANQFLAANPEFQLKQERALLPINDGVDGAYVACLTRFAPLSSHATAAPR